MVAKTVPIRGVRENTALGRLRTPVVAVRDRASFGAATTHRGTLPELARCHARRKLDRRMAKRIQLTHELATACAATDTPLPAPAAAAPAVSVDFMLIRRCNEGDGRAFEVLVTKYQRKVASLINWSVHNHAVAEELTQEAFLRAYRALGSFRFESAFSTWLYAIARNIARSYQRNGQQFADNGASLDVLADDAEHWGHVFGRGYAPSPEEHLSNMQLVRAIEYAIDGMSPQMRTSLTMREVEEFSYAAIAERLGIPLNTVRSLIFRARATIALNVRPVEDRVISAS